MGKDRLDLGEFSHEGASCVGKQAHAHFVRAGVHAHLTQSGIGNHLFQVLPIHSRITVCRGIVLGDHQQFEAIPVFGEDLLQHRAVGGPAGLKIRKVGGSLFGKGL